MADLENVVSAEVPKPISVFRSTRAFVAYGVGGALILATLVIGHNITIFSIQPIGMLPEGKTVIVGRLENGKLFDSADAMCKRTNGGVSLLCRMVALTAALKDNNIYMRLPYQDWAYKLSTGGAEYDR